MFFKSQADSKVLSKIDECQRFVDKFRKKFGPRGEAKWTTDANGKMTNHVIASMTKNIFNVHPAAKELIKYAKIHNDKWGDGANSVLLLAGAIFKEVRPFILKGANLEHIIDAVLIAEAECQKQISKLAETIPYDTENKYCQNLLKCTANRIHRSILRNDEKEVYLSKVVKAVRDLDRSLLPNMIGIQQVFGGELNDSKVVPGIAFNKTISNEVETNTFNNGKIAMLYIDLRLSCEREREDAEYRVNIEHSNSPHDDFWTTLEKIHSIKANVVLSGMPIGDTAKQYFAHRGILCAGRMPEEDLKRTMKACGGAILSTLHHLTADHLGECGSIKEQQIGGELFNILADCSKAKVSTIVLCQAYKLHDFVETMVRDAITFVNNVMKGEVVAGGGATEMQISKKLRDYAQRDSNIEVKPLIEAIANALEIIPRQLCENAGFDASTILDKLRQKHNSIDNKSYGVDFKTKDIGDNWKELVLEPRTMKSDSLESAFVVVRRILTTNYDDDANDEPRAAPRSVARTSNDWLSKIFGGIGFFLIAFAFQFFFENFASFLEKPATFANTIVTFVAFCVGGVAIIRNGIERTILSIAEFIQKILEQSQM